jgi:hypothetical protein
MRSMAIAYFERLRFGVRQRSAAFDFAHTTPRLSEVSPNTTLFELVSVKRRNTAALQNVADTSSAR